MTFHKVTRKLACLVEVNVDQNEDANVSDGEREDEDDNAADGQVEATAPAFDDDAMDIDANPINNEDENNIIDLDGVIDDSSDCSSEICDLDDPLILDVGYLAIRMRVAVESTTSSDS